MVIGCVHHQPVREVPGRRQIWGKIWGRGGNSPRALDPRRHWPVVTQNNIVSIRPDLKWGQSKAAGDDPINAGGTAVLSICDPGVNVRVGGCKSKAQ